MRDIVTRSIEGLGIGRDGLSKLEERGDLMLSTLRRTVEAMGGRLSLVAEVPDHLPVALSGIAEDESHLKPKDTKSTMVGGM